MKKTFSVLFLTLLVFGPIASGGSNDVLHVSMVQLLSNPEKYDGKKILVSGVLHVEFENSSLFLSNEHSRHRDVRSAIWVSYIKNGKLKLNPETDEGLKYYNRSWVLLKGRFTHDKSGQHGHMGMFAGLIDKVESVSEI